MYRDHRQWKKCPLGMALGIADFMDNAIIFVSLGFLRPKLSLWIANWEVSRRLSRSQSKQINTPP